MGILQRMMKPISNMFALVFTLNLALGLAAHAAVTWNYTAEKSGPIKGGEIRLSVIKTTERSKTLKLKWKVDTSVGPKKDWIPYTFPIEIFSSNYLSQVAVEQTKDLGTFNSGLNIGKEVTYKLQRLDETTYFLSNEELRFKFVVNKKGGAWKRIDALVKLKGITVNFKGNLAAITQED